EMAAVSRGTGPGSTRSLAGGTVVAGVHEREDQPCGARLPGDRGRVPDLYLPRFAAIPAARGDVPAVGADGHAGDRLVVSTQGEHLLTRQGVPDLDGVVGTARDDPLAIRAVHQAANPSGVSAQAEQLLPRDGVPHLYGTVCARRGQLLAPRTVNHG